MVQINSGNSILEKENSAVPFLWQCSESAPRFACSRLFAIYSYSPLLKILGTLLKVHYSIEGENFLKFLCMTLLLQKKSSVTPTHEQGYFNVGTYLLYVPEYIMGRVCHFRLAYRTSWKPFWG